MIPRKMKFKIEKIKSKGRGTSGKCKEDEMSKKEIKSSATF